MKTSLLLLVAATVGQLDLADLAVADLARVPAEHRHQVRYLVLDDFPPAVRPLKVKVFSGHCNGLSRETDLTPLYVVPGSQLALVRLALDDYAWKFDTWEQLADVDPWDHVTVETISEPAALLPFSWKIFPDNPGQKFLYRSGEMVGGYDLAGSFFRPFAAGQWGKSGPSPFPVDRAQPGLSTRRRVLTDRLGKGVAQLATLTGSQAPILRASWFFNQTAAAESRKPSYYDFLGIKDEKAFQALVGFDPTKTRRKVELREAVADSGVAPGAVRGIVRETAEDGPYWVTYDFRRGLDRVNPLRVLGRDLDVEFRNAKTADVATEQQGPLANGLWAWFLGDNTGKRQATAPDFAASDHVSRSNDKRVHVNVSCLRCHVPGGVQAVDGWVRNLIQPPLALQSPDYRKLRELRQQYLRRLVPYIERDRAAYAAAVIECTGLDAKTFQAAYAAEWERYEDARVDAAWAARDLGLTEKVFVGHLSAYLKATGNLDPVLSVFLLTGTRRRTIAMRQWEEAFPIARQLSKGSRP